MASFCVHSRTGAARGDLCHKNHQFSRNVVFRENSCVAFREKLTFALFSTSPPTTHNALAQEKTSPGTSYTGSDFLNKPTVCVLTIMTCAPVPLRTGPSSVGPFSFAVTPAPCGICHMVITLKVGHAGHVHVPPVLPLHMQLEGREVCNSRAAIPTGAQLFVKQPG